MISKKNKLMSLVMATVIAGSTFLPLAPVYAGTQTVNGMNIDVNYDPFTDEIKKDEDASKVDESKMTFSQRMALKKKQEEVTISQSSVVPGHIYIPKRTAMEVQLMDRLDCKKVQKYQAVDFKTVENLIINGVVVIPAGSIGKGYVYEVQKPGGFGRKGVLRVAAYEIKTINGIKVPLMKGLEGKGKTDGGAVAVAAAVSLLGGIFMKGSGVVYEPGTSFIVEVKNDTDLQCTPENLAKTMDPTVPRGQVIYVPVK